MTPCPAKESWHDYLLDRLSTEEADRLALHLDVCDACQDVFDALLGTGAAARALIVEVTERASSDSMDRAELTYLRALALTTPTEETAPVPEIPGYRLEHVLGEGGMGIVYLATDVKAQRKVAIKILKQSLSAEQRGRFEREAQLIGKVTDPHFVRLLHVGEVQSTRYLVLEYVEGQSLAQTLTGIPWEDRRAARFVSILARAMANAHSLSCVHRDLKPSNILIADEAMPRITDFGLAKDMQQSEEATRPNTIMGSPRYMAPEQASTHHPASPATDVYSLGVILYELLVGRPPFVEADDWSTMQRVVHDAPESPRRLRPKLARDLETICLKCLEKDRKQRYGDGAALADDLDRFLQHRPIRARPTPWWRRTAQWCRRHPAVLLSAGLILLLAVAFVLNQNSMLAQVRQERDRANEKEEAALEQARLAKHNKVKAEEHRQQAEKEREVGARHQQNLGISFAKHLFDVGQWREAHASLHLVPQDRRGWEWRRLLHLLEAGPIIDDVVGCHDFGIVAAALSPSGKKIATSGHDGRVLVWDIGNHTYKTLQDGSWDDAKARWRPLTDVGASQSIDGVCALAWTSDTELIGATLQGRVLSWELSDAKPLVRYQHNRPLYTLLAHPASGSILAGDDQGSVICLSKNGKPKRLSIGSAPVLALARIGDGFWIAGNREGRVALIEPHCEAVVQSLLVAAPVWGFDVDSSGNQLAVACGQPSAATWRFEAGERRLVAGAVFELRTFQAVLPRALHCVRWDRSGNGILAGDDHGRLIRWKVGQSHPIWTAKDQQDRAMPADRFAAFPLPYQRRVSEILGGGMEMDTHSAETYWFTTGQDTLIKRWHFKTQKGRDRLDAGDDPKMIFDAGGRMWTTNKAGALAVWDIHGLKRLDEKSAHAVSVRSIAIARGANMVATAASDGVVKFWAFHQGTIGQARPPIHHSCGIRCCSLDAQARWMAIYDDDDAVTVYDMRSEDKKLSVPLEGVSKGPALRGIVSLNSKGDRLAVSGPGQSFRVFSTAPLKQIAHLDSAQVAHQGGTALAWHPLEPHGLVSGDSGGRVRPHFLSDFTTHGYDRGQDLSAIVGIGFSPDGDRLAFANSNGEVSLAAYRGIGVILQDRSSHASPLIDIAFDPTGTTLALLHRDGEVHLWRTAPVIPSLHSGPTAWREKVLWNLPEDFRCDVSAVEIDDADNLWTLAVESQRDAASNKLNRSTIALRKSGATETVSIHHWMGESHAGWHTLSASGDEILAVVHERATYVTGQSHLHRFSAASGNRLHSEPLFPGAANWGAYPQVISEPKPTVLHFSHDGHYLFHTRRDSSGWQTERIGRQGDGLSLACAKGVDGKVHLAFHSWRFPGDSYGNIYIRANPDPWKEETREAVIPGVNVGPWSFGVSPEGIPTMVYFRDDSAFSGELWFAERREGVWKHARIRAHPCRSVGLGKLRWDRRGRVAFLFCEEDMKSPTMALRQGTDWILEPVVPPSKESRWFGSPELLFNRKNEPIIFTGQRSIDGSPRFTLLQRNDSRQ